MVIDEVYVAEQKYVNVLLISLETFLINSLGNDSTVNCTSITPSANESVEARKFYIAFNG